MIVEHVWRYPISMAPQVGLTRRRLLATPLAVPLAAQTHRPNIVFILVDDLRWDELRCTGHPFAQSPHADRLAREGANYQNAFASVLLENWRASVSSSE